MNTRAQISILVFLLSALLAACAAPPPTPLPPTATPTATTTPTPTIVWFPPTNTPTAAPTLAPIPTLDLASEAGPELFRDDFSDETFWSVSGSAQGAAAIANNHITLTASASKVYLYTLRRQPLLSNFYLEITASPNLCRGADEYGLFIRTTADFDYYRFGFSCDGRAHVDRLYRGAANAMQVWAGFPFLPAGPADVRLGVWADGQELRFYANGHYLFSVTDSVLYTGTLGLYIRSAGEAGMSVSFSDLVVYSLP
ncbi:MAG: hypothetical protein HYZ26_13565 [Chloroflexi bacterium]|nr:hypothetical protein [Chloroflexota bacterium]